MANTTKYLNHLLQQTGITPACSEEERLASELIADTFRAHGFEPEIQEFSASGSEKIVQAVLGIVVFLGAFLMVFGGVVGGVGFLLVIAAAVLFWLRRSGRLVFSQLGSGGLSQNVIAYHKASGPVASPRNRPVVVVAHYDSPRSDLLYQEPFAPYHALLVKLTPYAMTAPAILAIVRLLPLPGGVKVVLWLIALVAALVPLAGAVAVLANRFALPYTSGSVCNKSSVAALLGVMDAVAPFEGDEFPEDVPFDEYLAEQRELAAPPTPVIEPGDEGEDDESALLPLEFGEDAEIAGGALLDVPAGSLGTLAGETVAPGETSSIPTDGPVVSTDMLEAPAVDAADAEPPAEAVLEGAEEELPEGQDEPPVETAEGDEPSSSADEEAELELDEPAEDADALDSPDKKEDAAEDAPSEKPEPDASFEPEDAVDEQIPSGPRVNRLGNVRHGSATIRSLGMIAESCKLVYEDAEEEMGHGADMAATTPVPGDGFAADAGDVEQGEPGAEDAAALLFDDEAVGEETGAFDGAFAGFYDDGADDEGFFENGAEPYELVGEIVDDEDVGEDLLSVTVLEVGEPPVAEDAPDEGGALEAGGVGAADLDSSLPSENDADRGEGDAAAEDDEAKEEAPLEGGESPEAPADGSEEEDPDATITFTPDFDAADSDATQEAPGKTARPVETVDSLMAQIDAAVPAQKPATSPRVGALLHRQIPPVVPDPAQYRRTVNRSALFDIPDPSVASRDPFESSGPIPRAGSLDKTASHAGFTVIGPNDPVPASTPGEGESAPAAQAESPKRVEKKRRGLSGLFGRKNKKKQDSMSEWLGVDDDFDAKRSGGKIGSWDNFEDDDDDWKGGATGTEGVSESEMRDAITSMGDDELLGHDIWFVATGASELGNAGMKAFLGSHRDRLRGVFLINLESVGAGRLAMLATEGGGRTLKGDKRIMNLVRRVSGDFHNEFAAVDMPFIDTDAHAAMELSLRSLTIAGVDAASLACARSEEDHPLNVDVQNIADVADVVTEVIRRS